MRLCLIIFFTALYSGLFAQDASELLAQAQKQLNEYNEPEAYALYKRVQQLQPNNVVVLCKCADLACRIGNRQMTTDQKTAWFKTGKLYAEAAYKLAPDNAECNIVMAFWIARMALIQPPKQKVAAAGMVKKYAMDAIKYDPKSFKAYHILGRWHYEVSGLGVIERTFAKWFYGALPEASLGEAISNYEHCMALAPKFLLNYLELARACYRDGQKARAIELLKKMDEIPDGMRDDQTVRAEGKKLLKDWE